MMYIKNVYIKKRAGIDRRGGVGIVDEMSIKLELGQEYKDAIKTPKEGNDLFNTLQTYLSLNPTGRAQAIAYLTALSVLPKYRDDAQAFNPAGVGLAVDHYVYIDAPKVETRAPQTLEDLLFLDALNDSKDMDALPEFERKLKHDALLEAFENALDSHFMDDPESDGEIDVGF